MAKQQHFTSHRIRTFLLRFAVVLVVGVALLAIPEWDIGMPEGAGKAPFVWDRQSFWSDLESRFLAARQIPEAELRESIHNALQSLNDVLETMGQEELSAADSRFDTMQQKLFEVAPLVAACPGELVSFTETCTRARALTKEQSLHWSMETRTTRIRLYGLLYGTRAALEEVMLQAPVEAVPSLTIGSEVSSVTPSAEVEGVRVHSGDILLSRGGAATSALIARGNDFPGNFSHVALVHVSKAGRVSVIEAHIESGVSVRPIDEYLKETKLRIMLLRVRSNLPPTSQAAMLPHEAATHALEAADQRHIPYDFAMDFSDPEKQFCSEVASSAYRAEGLELWMGLSHLSSPGLTRWLSRLGVRHFETQEPSDLEYDPQLGVVAEWRDPQALFKDHVDNAVIDAMLEGAEAGDRLDYDWRLLPAVRLMKGYSVLANWFGGVGPVPEGMSATTALRVRWFTRRHERLREQVLASAVRFKETRGYAPPYWELVRMAVDARERGSDAG